MKYYDSNCIFCKIAHGEIKAYKIYEDDHVIAFLDTNPKSMGHALVIPKKHYDNFLNVDKAIMHRVYDVAQKIGQADMVALGAVGINVLTNCYEPAGQTVMHFHVHVIPRYINNERHQIDMKNDIDDKNLPAIVTKIQQYIK